MRPKSSLSSSDGFQPWQSPIPYLFGGLAAMMVLIAVALILLACYQHRSLAVESRQPASRPEKSEISTTEMERGVVVIMAGDELPTYLANPLRQPASRPEKSEISTTEMERGVVVIMAGDELPTYLANPLSAISTSSSR
ncbi:protein GLUTAMINE DUMPER 2-like [Phalaenopsis equestris]|uniref:protein GLUTAMINE DUMPER 2-like n=1 Tax=Phalaenopsis equestris TaxID=78828 RepID=UPI0009E43A80|nr:protein GLUTAMINE DUMPER 2-like [Phalaenopsis equestris]